MSILSSFLKTTEPILKTCLNRLYNVEITGLDNLDLSKKTILMPNHVSLLDAVILATKLPKEVVFVVNTAISKKYQSILSLRKHITIDPLNPMSIRRMIKLVNEGTPIMIFPEGRITRTGTLMKIYTGTGFLALKTGANIHPIAIKGLERSKMSYLKDKVKTKLFPKVSISIGKSYKIEKEKNLPLKIQKEKASNTILKLLQNELLNLKLKNNVNLFNELLINAKLNGYESKILEDINGNVSYKKLILNTYVLSNKLNQSLNNEKNIGLLLPTSIAHIATLFSLFRIGKTPAILNFTMGKQTFIECCETANIKTIITSKEFIQKGKLEHLIQSINDRIKIIYLEDTKAQLNTLDKLKGLINFKLKNKSEFVNNNEIILFTSGSENKPKGVILTHENLYSNIQQALISLDITSKDKLFNPLPMFHSFGLTIGTILPIITGLPVYLYPTPLHYKVIPELIYDSRSTIMIGTSTFLSYWGKFAHPYDFDSIRYILVGAEKLKDEIRELYFRKFKKGIFEGYGATETSPVLSINTPLLNKDGTVGQFLPGIEYKINKIEGIQNGGNLLVKGPNIMKGYLIHGKGFVKNEEWYDTGDIVDINDGFIEIKSRLKRFAKIGGEMISLNLVEEISSKCFKDTNVAVINVPDNRKGEKLILYTTNESFKLETLRQYVFEKNYSQLIMPSKIIFIKQIPVLGSGKTDYISLKNNYDKNI